MKANCPDCKPKEECKKCKRNRMAREKREVLKSLGLTRVRGALGGIYWE